MKNKFMALKHVAQYLEFTVKAAFLLSAQGHLSDFKVRDSWHSRTEDIKNVY